MEKNVYLIKWYGPFKNREEVKEFEEEQSFKCSLYLLHGKPKFAKKREKYYCGMSIRNINDRLRDKGHHIEEFRSSSIYVGCLANVKRPVKSQILVTEKIITACLTDIVGKDNVFNATNKYFPAENVFVINEWWKKNGEAVWERCPKNTPSNIIPDVLTYHYKGNDDNELFGCKKLKRIYPI